jgi:hypothetical protein
MMDRRSNRLTIRSLPGLGASSRSATAARSVLELYGTIMSGIAGGDFGATGALNLEALLA